MLFTFVRDDRCREAAETLLEGTLDAVELTGELDVLAALASHARSSLIIDYAALQSLDIEGAFRLDDAVRATDTSALVLLPENSVEEEDAIRSMTRLTNFWVAPWREDALPEAFRSRLERGAKVEARTSEKTLHRDLPWLKEGRLGSQRLHEVLWAIREFALSGELVVEQGRRNVTIRVADGSVLLTHEDEERRISDAFSWGEGKYSFKKQRVPVERSRVAIERLLLDVTMATTDINSVARWLGGFDASWCVSTREASARLGELAEDADVKEMMAACDGGLSIEELWKLASGSTRRIAFVRLGELIGALVLTKERPQKSPSLAFHLPTRAPSPSDTRPSSVGPPVDESVVDELIIELTEKLGRMDKEDPWSALGLTETSTAEEFDEAYYNAIRENHPDVYAHIRNAEVEHLAEKVFLRVRALRKQVNEELRRLERTGAVSPRTGAQSGASPSVPSAKSSGGTRRSVSQPTAKPMPRPTPERTAPPEAVEPSRARVGDPSDDPFRSSPTSVTGKFLRRKRSAASVSQNTKDALDRQSESGSKKQAEASDKPPEPPPKSPEELKREERMKARERLRQVRREETGVAPDQLGRAAHHALESGAHDRARSLLLQAIRREAPVEGVEGLLLYSEWLLTEKTDQEAIEGLKALIGEAEDPKEQSVFYMLLGHIARLAGDLKRAEGHYRDSLRANKDNHDSYRWMRYITTRKNLATTRAAKSNPTSGSIFRKWFGKG